MAPRRIHLRSSIRRIPGARRARALVPRLFRRSRALRAIVRRIYAVDGSLRVPVDVGAGRLLVGIGTESLPVVVVVIIGADARTIERTIDEVARLQVVTAGFRPVIVADRPAFVAARKYGYPTELLVSAEDWRDSHLSWEEYARRIIGLIFEGYRATASVAVGADGLNPAARVVLGSLRDESRARERSGKRSAG